MKEETEKETGEQHENRTKKKAEWLAPWQFKKGQSGNPSGRPAGISLKEYAKKMLNSMDEKERQEFLHGLSKETIWKLAEGNPANATDITSKGEKILVMPQELINKNDSDPKPSDNSTG